MERKVWVLSSLAGPGVAALSVMVLVFSTQERAQQYIDTERWANVDMPLRELFTPREVPAAALDKQSTYLLNKQYLVTQEQLEHGW